MKKTMQQFLLIAGMLLIQQFASAQTEPDAPPTAARWVSEKGYWIVENNVTVPKKYVVYFYTNEGQLIHKQNIEGVTLKVHRRRVKMRLKRTLETAVLAWEKNHKPDTGKQSMVVSQ